MVGGGWEPHGARLSHVLMFVMRHLDRTKIRGVPRSLGRGVWEGRWLAGYSRLAYEMGYAGLTACRLAGLWDGMLAGWRAGGLAEGGGSKSG